MKPQLPVGVKRSLAQWALQMIVLATRKRVTVTAKQIADNWNRRHPLQQITIAHVREAIQRLRDMSEPIDSAPRYGFLMRKKRVEVVDYPEHLGAIFNGGMRRWHRIRN